MQTEINEVLCACIERINLLQREDLEFYERRKLAIEFKEFVDKYVNPEYRDNFYQFINNVLSKYRSEVQYEAADTSLVEKDEDVAEASVKLEWPSNCTHIKIAFNIWYSKKNHFKNPLEIAQMLKQVYYDEISQNQVDFEIPEQNPIISYLEGLKAEENNKLPKNFPTLPINIKDIGNVASLAEQLQYNRDLYPRTNDQASVDRSTRTGLAHCEPKQAF